MTHQGDVGLVVDDSGKDVVGRNRHRESFALPECRGCFIDASGLRQQDRRQGMHEREMSAIAGRVQGRRGFRQVIADDAGVADLLVNRGPARSARGRWPEIRVRVRRVCAHANAARSPAMFAPCERRCARATATASKAAPPRSFSSTDGRYGRADDAWTRSSCRSQASARRGPDVQLVFAVQGSRAQQGNQMGGSFGPAATLEGCGTPARGSMKGLQRRTSGVYKVYKPGRLIIVAQCRWRPMASPIRVAALRTKTPSLVDPDRGLFVVADGMGGHNAGEVASSLAVKAIAEFLSTDAAELEAL